MHCASTSVTCLLLEELPKLSYLHLRSDGRPSLEPVTGLTALRALMLGVSALRGELDVRGFPQLRWFRASLGGKGGKALHESLGGGHPCLEYLTLTRVRRPLGVSMRSSR